MTEAEAAPAPSATPTLDASPDASRVGTISGGVEAIGTARRALVGRCATSSGGASYHDRWRLYLHNIGTDAAAIRGEA